MGSESNIQANIRLAAAQDRVFLMRNNSGALPDSRGRWVRFGLGNDSAAVNDKRKSSDPCKQVALVVPAQLARCNIGN